MRQFKTSFIGTPVDLDDPQTYDHLPKTTKELDNMMFCEIGKALTYMDYFHSDMFSKKKKYMINPFTDKKQLDCGYTQRLRVNALIDNFAKNRRDHYDDVLWLQEQIFLFQDETENMC